MVQGEPSFVIDVQDGEGGAGHRAGYAQAPGDAAGKLAFPGPHVPAQHQHAARGQPLCHLGGEGSGFFGGEGEKAIRLRAAGGPGAGGFGVPVNLLLERGHRGEESGFPEIPKKRKLNGFPVQVAMVVRQEGFHGDLVPVVRRGAEADVGDAQMAAAIQAYAGPVYALGRQDGVFQ